MGGSPRVFVIALPVVACGVLLAGCGAGAGLAPSATPLKSAASVSRSASRSVSPSVKVDPGQQAAMAKVVEFMTTLSRVSNDPMVPLDELHTVASGDSFFQWATNIRNERTAQQRDSGDYSLKFLRATRGSSERQWLLTYCVDISQVLVVDKDGNPVGDQSITHMTMDFTVEQDASTKKWYVVKDLVTKCEC